nr:GNAT family N-acetyltransferase [Sphingorhabdus sp.]
GLDGGLTIETGSGSRDLDWHYRIYSESVRNLGTPVFPRALMAQTLSAFGDDADILTVLFNGVPVASVLSLYHKGAVMPYWGGGIWAARALRANDVMYYALMNHARRKGCMRFDFGRSKVESGAYFFKKNWGFQPEPLTYSTRTAVGVAPRDVNPTSGKYSAFVSIWQKMPLPLANLAGPWISRGLG